MRCRILFLPFQILTFTPIGASITQKTHFRRSGLALTLVHADLQIGNTLTSSCAATLHLKEASSDKLPINFLFMGPLLHLTTGGGEWAHLMVLFWKPVRISSNLYVIFEANYTL